MAVFRIFGMIIIIMFGGYFYKTNVPNEIKTMFYKQTRLFFEECAMPHGKKESRINTKIFQ